MSVSFDVIVSVQSKAKLIYLFSIMFYMNTFLPI